MPLPVFGLTPLRDHVGSVVGRRPEKEMVWSDAAPYVASVEYPEFGREAWVDKQTVSGSGRYLHCAPSACGAESYDAVDRGPVGSAAASPEPTLCLEVADDMRHEQLERVAAPVRALAAAGVAAELAAPNEHLIAPRLEFFAAALANARQPERDAAAARAAFGDIINLHRGTTLRGVTPPAAYYGAGAL